MESAENYWTPVYNILETDCKIVLAHPSMSRPFAAKKPIEHDLVSGSFIPPAEIRQFRDLMRYRNKLTNFSTGEKNRAQNCLTVSNIKLDDVFSDVFGKSASFQINCLSFFVYHALRMPKKIRFRITPSSLKNADAASRIRKCFGRLSIPWLSAAPKRASSAALFVDKTIADPDFSQYKSRLCNVLLYFTPQIGHKNPDSFRIACFTIAPYFLNDIVVGQNLPLVGNHELQQLVFHRS